MPIKIGKWIAGIWKGIEKWFQKLPKPIQMALHVGVAVTDKLKNFVESDVADILTAVIPGDIDDKIKEKLREKLPVILVELKLAEKCSGLTGQELVACAIDTLRQMSADYKKGFLDELAVQIALVYADGKLTWDDLKYSIKWYYDHVHKKAA